MIAPQDNYHRKLQNVWLPLYVACGSTANYVDQQGITWVPDGPLYAKGGLVATTVGIANPIAATERYWLAGSPENSGEQIIVGIPGIYTVTIYLAERYFNQPGLRLFNIQVGDAATANYKKISPNDIDLFAQFGYGNLGAFPVDVVVTSGTINIIVLSGAVNNPKMSGFSVVFMSPLSQMPTLRPSTILPTTPSASPSTVKPTISIVPSFRSSATPSAAPTMRQTSNPSKPLNKDVNYAFSYPICAKTGGAQVLYSPQGLCSAHAGIKEQFLARVKFLEAQNTNAARKQLASMYGKAVRMVFHDAVDLDLTKPDLMGADGCIGDAHDSAGLIEPTSPIFTVYEPIYQSYCDQINRADFYVLMGKLVIETAEPTHTIDLTFQYGRRETYDCSEGIGRDPDAQLGVHAIHDSFIVQMGLTYEDAGMVYTLILPIL